MCNVAEAMAIITPFHLQYQDFPMNPADQMVDSQPMVWLYVQTRVIRNSSPRCWAHMRQEYYGESMHGHKGVYDKRTEMKEGERNLAWAVNGLLSNIP